MVSVNSDPADSVESRRFSFWTPDAGAVVHVGPEQQPVLLPQVDLPILEDLRSGGHPDDDAIGKSVYEYLRQFPDCAHNRLYAGLLRDAYPQYIADLAAHAVMLGKKDVEAAYVRRKLTCLKILALLEPDNPGLLQQLGLISLELAQMFEELPDCRNHLLRALGYLQQALKKAPEDLATINALAQVDYLFGDYPGVARYWQTLCDRLPESPARHQLEERLAHLQAGEVPDHPLVDDLEAVGRAMLLFWETDYPAAIGILERLEGEGEVMQEFPMPEFHYLHGLCRLNSGDLSGARTRFDKALELDADFAPARNELKRLEKVER